MPEGSDHSGTSTTTPCLGRSRNGTIAVTVAPSRAAVTAGSEALPVFGVATGRALPSPAQVKRQCRPIAEGARPPRQVLAVTYWTACPW